MNARHRRKLSFVLPAAVFMSLAALEQIDWPELNDLPVPRSVAAMQAAVEPIEYVPVTDAIHRVDCPEGSCKRSRPCLLVKT